MKIICYFLFSILFFSTLAQARFQENQIDGKMNEGQCAPILYEEVELDSLETDYFQIVEIKIEGDCLKLLVNFGGGCGITNFRLITNNYVTESMHPKIEMFLQLEDKDTCKAMRQRLLQFDLEPFKGYQTRNGLLIYFINNQAVINYLD